MIIALMQTLRLKAFRVVLSDVASRETEEIHRGGAKLKRLRNLLLASPQSAKYAPAVWPIHSFTA